MNIRKAKEQIVNSVKAYLAKDGNGKYLIPQHKQRPLFLMGPPGIGKTEIVQQAASGLGIALLSYSMTHHTRQSAVGLPIIRQKEYKGEKFEASEYSMSEILSSVYDIMNDSGLENGILFLDEVNCISETLTPVMLQFLQYKVFGGHRLPEGWIVVTAGNPPEYNSSVREFDIATWDRLKRIDVEPDLEVWKEYARNTGVHNSVISYLEIKPGSFYSIEAALNGKCFSTARGWDDLSRMISAYEKLGIPVDRELIRQYIQIDAAADDFALYYELYKKYKSDYRITDILCGKTENFMIRRAAEAKFDERYSLLGLLMESLRNEADKVMEEDSDLAFIREKLIEAKAVSETEKSMDEILCGYIQELEDLRRRLKGANSLSGETESCIIRRINRLTSYRSAAVNGFEGVKTTFEGDVSSFKDKVKRVSSCFSNVFLFCEEAFGADREMLLLVTELAADRTTAKFISAFGCEEYHKYDKLLMFKERRSEISREINKLYGI